MITRKASAIAGPECAAGGPTVDVAITSIKAGKPPHSTWVADLRVRNPGTVPVWLLYDVGDGDMFQAQAILTSLVLSGIGPGGQGQVWSFSGDDSFEAVRIPGEADLLLRDAEFNTNEERRPQVLVFAKQISVDGRAAEAWFGRPGLLPPAGDFSVSPKAPYPNIEREWKRESPYAPVVEVDVLCASHVDLAATIPLVPRFRRSPPRRPLHQIRRQISMTCRRMPPSRQPPASGPRNPNGAGPWIETLPQRR